MSTWLLLLQACDSDSEVHTRLHSQRATSARRERSLSQHARLLAGCTCNLTHKTSPQQEVSGDHHTRNNQLVATVETCCKPTSESPQHGLRACSIAAVTLCLQQPGTP